MSLKPTLSVIVGSAGVLGLVGLSAYLILQTCSLQFPPLMHLSSCAKPDQQEVAVRLADANENNRELSRRIFELERELAVLQCVKGPPDATSPLNDEGWKNSDLEMLYGCWALDTTYRTRDVDTGAIRTYRDWQMCFDTQGNGKQVMRSDDGIVCEGSVQAQLARGQLDLIEPGNLTCQDGGYIHQRQITCSPAPGGKASCDTFQPETKGKATVGFERAL